jgi:hypothetical protein
MQHTIHFRDQYSQLSRDSSTEKVVSQTLTFQRDDIGGLSFSNNIDFRSNPCSIAQGRPLLCYTPDSDIKPELLKNSIQDMNTSR